MRVKVLIGLINSCSYETDLNRLSKTQTIVLKAGNQYVETAIPLARKRQSFLCRTDHTYHNLQ